MAATLGEDGPVDGSNIIVAMLPELGAASIGAVVTLIVVDRIILGRPVGTKTRLRFAAWATTLATGVAIETALFAGFGALALLSTGAVMGGLARMAMMRALQDQP